MTILSEKETQEPIDKLNKKGHYKVREELSQSIYSETKKKIALNWLKSLERNIEDKKHQEILHINKSLKNSSWVAAITAIASAIISIIAAFLTYYYRK